MTMNSTLTANGENAIRDGAVVWPRTKLSPEVRCPEAVPAIQAFGRDPAALAGLLQRHESLHLSIYPGVRLALACHNAILAEIELPYPDYWVGMGATAAARKCGVLPS